MVHLEKDEEYYLIIWWPSPKMRKDPEASPSEIRMHNDFRERREPRHERSSWIAANQITAALKAYGLDASLWVIGQKAEHVNTSAQTEPRQQRRWSNVRRIFSRQSDTD